MKIIRFSNDYTKLPKDWEGTQAALIGVYGTSVKELKTRYEAFWKYDTEYRDKSGRYPFHFKEALILIFIHLKTGIPFTTIRSNYKDKCEYYIKSIGETFFLKRN